MDKFWKLTSPNFQLVLIIVLSWIVPPLLYFEGMRAFVGVIYLFWLVPIFNLLGKIKDEAHWMGQKQQYWDLARADLLKEEALKG